MASPIPHSPTPITAADLTAGEWRERFAALARVPVDEPVPEEFHAAVVGLLSAPKASQRAKAVSAAVRVGAPIVPHLLAVLADAAPDEIDAQRAVLDALEQLGPAALPAVEVLRELAGDPWLGACAQSALAAIDPPRYSGFQLLCAAVTVAGLLTAAFTAAPTSGIAPVAATVGVVGWCVAIGLWWARPGAVGLVCVFAVGFATLTAVGATGGVASVFSELSHVHVRR